MRLLAPDDYMLARVSQRVCVQKTTTDFVSCAEVKHSQSFLYYGVGSPCGLLMPGEQNILIPDYTPPLYIFPHMYRENEFRWWSLQLLSMTLLEPLVQNPNYATLEPTQWFPKRIPMPCGENPGIRVMFDSGERIILTTTYQANVSATLAA